MIEIKNLNKYYSKGRSNEVHAVNDVSMSLPDNGMVAIFGKSGCGKTTLLNIIGGLDNAQDGSVCSTVKKSLPIRMFSETEAWDIYSRIIIFRKP